MVERRGLWAVLAAGLVGLSAAPALAQTVTRNRTVSVTGAHGRTWTGQSTRVTDRATGQTTRTAVQTGPGGRTRTVQGQGTFTNGGYSGTRTVTGPGGQTRTQEINVTRQ